MQAFGVYRILAAAVIFLLMYKGVIKQPEPSKVAAPGQVSVVGTTNNSMYVVVDNTRH
jgi:hypothetical protein